MLSTRSIAWPSDRRRRCITQSWRRGVQHAGALRIERQQARWSIVDVLQVPEKQWLNGRYRFLCIEDLAQQAGPIGERIGWLSRLLGVSPRTSQRWLRIYRKNPDVMALVPRAQGPAIGHRWIIPERETLRRDVVDDWVRAGQRSPITGIEEECERRGTAAKIAPPSRSCIAARLRDRGLDLNHQPLVSIRLWKRAIRNHPAVEVSDPERFVLDCLPAEVREVGRDGFQVGRIRYWDPLIPRLLPAGTRILMRYNPRDLSKVFVPAPDHSEYLSIPDADLRRPPITKAEVDRSRAILTTKGDATPSEDAIFVTAAAQRKLEDIAAKSTRRARRKSEQRPRQRLARKGEPKGTPINWDEQVEPYTGEVW